MKKLVDWRNNAQNKPPVIQVDEWINNDKSENENPFTTKTTQKPTDLIKNLTNKFTKDQ